MASPRTMKLSADTERDADRAAIYPVRKNKKEKKEIEDNMVQEIVQAFEEIQDVEEIIQAFEEILQAVKEVQIHCQSP